MAEISNRDHVLEDFKTCLTNITKANGFQNDVSEVIRKFVYYDSVGSFPLLMVLGGGEDFDDQMGNMTTSNMKIRIAGYSKDSLDPESASCSLIADILKCIDSDTYNSWKLKMVPISLETDEGMLHEVGEGVAMFVLNLLVVYRFNRSIP